MGIPVRDLKGQIFGHLRVIERTANSKDSHARWIVLCKCGEYRKVNGKDLTSGNNISCGCMRGKANRTHGDSLQKRGLYRTWANMITRCYYPNSVSYHNYGARGVTVCNEWKNSYSVFKEWAMENGYIYPLTIDRIDTDGHYVPQNCHFITRSENIAKGNKTRHTRRSIVDPLI